MVGDNVRKHPDVFKRVLERGHCIGNHTFNHIQGLKYWTKNFLANVKQAAELIPSKLFRPPHGHMRIPQTLFIRKHYKIVMWDVVTRDYSNLRTPEETLQVVKQYTRNGSIIVFHDSLRAERNMKATLPLAIEWLKAEGYIFKTLQ